MAHEYAPCIGYVLAEDYGVAPGFMDFRNAVFTHMAGDDCPARHFREQLHTVADTHDGTAQRNNFRGYRDCVRVIYAVGAS